MKRKLTRESLIRRHGKEILTSLAACEYCANTLHDVKCVHFDKEDLCISRNKLVERYSKGNTKKGTISFHHFFPTAIGSVVCNN